MFETLAFLSPKMTPIFLTGVLMWALAATLLALDFNNTLHRVFATFLGFSGGRFILATVRQSVEGQPEMYNFYTGLAPYLLLPLAPLALLFISHYPRPRGIGMWRHSPVVVALLVLGMYLWYMFDHSAYGTAGPVPSGMIPNAGQGLAYLQYGPLFLAASFRFAIAGVLAFILARDYHQAPHGSTGFSRFLVYAGFSLSALFSGTSGVLDLIYILQEPTPGYPWFPYGWAQIGMTLINLPLALGSLVYVFLASKGEGDTPSLQEPRRFLYYVAPLPVISALLLSYESARALLGDALHFILGLWQLAVPLLITYALMRYQVFGADATIKRSVAKVVLVGAFAAIFLVVLEAAEAILGDGLGFWFNVALAAVLALLAAPLQRFAAHAADRVMPDTKSVVEQDPFERGEFYRSQFALVEEDGVVSPKDRSMLDRLALSLRISDGQQADLEGGKNTLPRIEGYGEDISTDDGPRGRWNRAISALVAAALFGAVGQGLESLVPADNFGFSLLGAAFIALAIGPIGSLVDRLLEPAEERRSRRERLTTYRNAVQAAFVDGDINAKERDYLDQLQKELGLSQVERIQIHLRTARRVA